MRFRQGFTLLEMTIVLVIISVIMAGGAVTFSAHLQQRQVDETNFKIAAIQKALLEHRRTYNRLPCPSYLFQYDPEDTVFGTESNPIACASASYQYDVTNNDNACAVAPAACVVAGLVPVRQLMLPDDYAFDGWGRRFMYAIDRDFAQTDAFVSGTSTASISCDTNTSCFTRSPANRIIIRNLQGVTKTSLAAYVLLSFGQNGHGAYGRYINYSSLDNGGGSFALAGSYQVASLQTMNDGWELPVARVGTGEFQIAAGGGGGGLGYDGEFVRITSGSTNTSELENCDCVSGTGIDAAFDNVFVQGVYTPDYSDSMNTFDDILVFATRADLRSALE